MFLIAERSELEYLMMDDECFDDSINESG